MEMFCIFISNVYILIMIFLLQFSKMLTLEEMSKNTQELYYIMFLQLHVNLWLSQNLKHQQQNTGLRLDWSCRP